jgi:hypothetical protein
MHARVWAPKNFPLIARLGEVTADKGEERVSWLLCFFGITFFLNISSHVSIVLIYFILDPNIFALSSYKRRWVFRSLRT